MRRTLGSVARVCVVLGAIAAGVASTTKSPEEKAEEAAKKEAGRREVATGSAVDVVAGQLYVDYKANEIGADEKYRDKVLRVTGIVARVGKNSFDEPEVRLVANGGRDSIEATFATIDGLGTLKRSDTITIRCRGRNSLGAPKLEDCVIEKSATAPKGAAQPDAAEKR